MDVNKEEPPLENPSLSNSSTCFHLDIRYVQVQNNCCLYKRLLHAKPSASVNTAVHIGGVYATDKLRRVELYREEVSNKQLYICILSDVSCRCTDNRKSVKHSAKSLVGWECQHICLPLFETGLLRVFFK